MVTIGKALLCLIFGLCVPSSFSDNKFSKVYEFTYLDFDYNSTSERDADIESGVFIPGQIAPIDTDVYYNSTTGNQTIFLTIPRFQDGVPATLGTIVLNSTGDPIVKPYPSWEWAKNPESCNENRIVSVYRILIDSCDRLWVMDGARIGDTVACTPQLLAFNLKNNTLISKYELPEDQWNATATFVTPIVEVLDKENECENTFVYMADSLSHLIVVYSHKNKSSWIVQDTTTMEPDTVFETYNITGISFEVPDGVLGLAVAPNASGDGNRLFYHALSSETEHWVKTSDLQNQTLINGQNYSDIFHTYNGTRHTQSAAQGVDKDGILYFGLMTNISVGCFNTNGEYGLPGNYSDVVSQNEEKLQFISGLKVVTDLQRHQHVLLISTRFQKVATGALNPNETNFRIQTASVESLKSGTKCGKPRSTAKNLERVLL